jgi:hypothetical protein
MVRHYEVEPNRPCISIGAGIDKGIMEYSVGQKRLARVNGECDEEQD